MIRFKSGDPKGIPSGYEQSITNSSADISVPPCGLEDVDVSMFNLFDKELRFEVSATSKTPAKRAPVIFASGEKWVQIKNSRIIRDENGQIKLPLITIVRTSVDQDPSEDISGRGINQQTGELIVRRRLSTADREYQSLINRLNIVNQLNVASRSGFGLDGQIETNRDIGDLSMDPDVIAGGLMTSNRLNNVWEVMTIPSPQFFTAKYEVTFWTQYAKHMSQMIDKFYASLLTPGNCFRLETTKGYWFLAIPDGSSFSPDNNFSDQAGKERLIKSKISMKVPGYIVASRSPGDPVPVRRMISNPTIEFTVQNSTEITPLDTFENEQLLGADDPTLPISDRQTSRNDKRLTTSEKFARSDLQGKGDPAMRVDSNGRPYNSGRGNYVTRTVINPLTGVESQQLVRIVSSTKQGEETYAAVQDTSGLTLNVRNRL